MEIADLERALDRAVLNALDFTAEEAPTFTGTCVSCGSNDFQGFMLFEFGYTRLTSLEADYNDLETEDDDLDEPGTLLRMIAYTDGWGDMSENGVGPEFVVCRSCGTVHGYPEVSVDYA